MNEILINIISVLVTAVIIPLISIGGTQLVKLINSKIKSTETAKQLTTATQIVTNATLCVFQTYVESLKAEGKFDKESQLVALERAKDIAISQMTDDVKEYIATNYGNLDHWLTTQIEATINVLKSF